MHAVVCLLVIWLFPGKGILFSTMKMNECMANVMNYHASPFLCSPSSPGWTFGSFPPLHDPLSLVCKSSHCAGCHGGKINRRNEEVTCSREPEGRAQWVCRRARPGGGGSWGGHPWAVKNSSEFYVVHWLLFPRHDWNDLCCFNRLEICMEMSTRSSARMCVHTLAER